MKRSGLVLLAVVALQTACGGDAAPPPPAASTATKAGAPGRGAAHAAGPSVPLDTSSTSLVREVFGYRGAGRDPFLSLLKSGSVRPLIGDLRVAGINYDPRYPAQSVVTLQDTSQHKRYTLHVNDEVGRIHVTEIRPQEVVLTIDEFGTQRQIVLSLKRRQEEAR
jgi:hypothetical protein